MFEINRKACETPILLSEARISNGEMHECERCGFKTSRLHGFKRHLNRKNPCKSVTVCNGNGHKQKAVCKLSPELIPDPSKKATQCEVCLKIFSSRPAKSRHKKNVNCKPPAAVCQPIVPPVATSKLEKQVCELQEEILMLKTRKNGFTESVKKRAASKQGWNCNLCDCKLPYNYQVDHIQAVCLGGKNDISNAQALCKPCHQMKTKLDALQLKFRKEQRLFPADHVVEVVLQKSAEVMESYLRQHHNEETIVGTGVLKHANVLEELACDFQEVWDDDKVFRSLYKPFVRTALLECMRERYKV